MNAEGPDGEGAVEVVVVVADVDAFCYCCCFCRLLCHCWCYCCLGDVALKTQDMKVGRVDCETHHPACNDMDLSECDVKSTLSIKSLLVIW